VVGGLGGVGKKEEQVEHTFLGGWNYTVWYYYRGYIPFNIGQNSDYVTPRIKPNINYGLHECMFISCSNSTTFTDSWGGCVCMRAGGMWEFSALSTQFYCEQ
jgi:hypothetical protein